jgi:uncharacterized protein (TIGR03083 family)
MGARRLRRYYDEPVEIEVDESLGSVVEPWVRHRRRFDERLGELSDEQWHAASRCAGWDTHDVVNHLVSADGFWVLSLRSGVAGAPTSYLVDFDPTATPEALVAPMRALPRSEVIEQFHKSTESFIGAVEELDDAAWSMTAESPFGQLPVRFVLAHAFWDSWLHERDIFVALGLDVPVEADELLLATWYSLLFGPVLGGLLDDPAPVGEGTPEAFEVALVFDDLPDTPLQLAVDRGVRIARGGADALDAGSAVDLCEVYTGRRGDPMTTAVPPRLAEQLRRAMQIL